MTTMRKIVGGLTLMSLVMLLFSWSSTTPSTTGSSAASAQVAQKKPNIVFILTDDMRKDDLKYMPKTRSLLGDKGMTFQNAFVSNALCCPTRSTIMRGQYSHNTGVWSNNSTDSSSTTSGGWQAYKDNGDEKDNVATRLHGAGYRTGLFGKYLNGYADGTTAIPQGWDRWFATQDGYFDYDVNDNGTVTHYGTADSDYQTDVLKRKTNTFITYSASIGKPFFAYVAPKAPHEPTIPAPRDAHTYDGLKAARPPSFNEADVSDKPSWIRQMPKLTSDKIAQIDAHHEARAETLQAVDDLVAGVVNTLNKAGVMNNTYIFFTSDNGWHEGEHRIPSEKWRPYEEDIHMPLLVRGPGVAAGSTPSKMALDTDYLPTFTDLACSSVPCDTQNWSYVPDGRSLRPVLKGNASTWRNSILLEAAAHYSPAYRGIRTVNTPTSTKRTYVEYSGGAKELYYLKSDPYELNNRYKASSPPTGLALRLKALKTCAGDACRKAEGGG